MEKETIQIGTVNKRMLKESLISTKSTIFAYFTLQEMIWKNNICSVAVSNLFLHIHLIYLEVKRD